jgi:hypothetical protein
MFKTFVNQPQQTTELSLVKLQTTELSHVPAGCKPVHDGQKPSARCWAAFLKHSQ